MPNLACNRASRGRPYERSRVGVAAADVVADRSFQFTDAAKSSPPDALVGNFREETLHQIQPRSAGGREVPVITRMRRKPRLHHRMRVGAIVVQDEMDHQSSGNAAFHAFQKTQKLLVAMARQALAQHLSAQHVQGREQRSGAVAGVIVSLPFWDSGTQRKNRLGTIQSLNLAL